MNFRKICKRIKHLFIHFWRSDNSKVSLLRDVFIAFLFVFIILLALWTYTGQWFGAPMVAIESGSMEHPNPPYGRIGTIDAGDMVLLVKVNSKNDVVPYSTSNYYNYGKKGDVVVYHPDGDLNQDQIIHRAMCWIEVEIQGSDTFYTIEEYGIIHQNASEPLYIPECGIWHWSSDSPVILDGKSNGPGEHNYHYQKFVHSGFITKGDNPNSNKACDQLGGICDQPVKVEWISGKASGELPWIGTINLFFNDVFGGKDTLKNVHGDSIQCLIILIVVLVSIPISLDLYGYFKSKKEPIENNPLSKQKTLEQKVNDELFEKFKK
jgi:signal peptidase